VVPRVEAEAVRRRHPEGEAPGGLLGAGRQEAGAAFALPMLLEHGGRVLSFVSSIATFNTPMDVTVAELAIETFLPADRETAAYLHAHVPS
ncbi:transcriptional regulator, partial [Streptomyces sp. NPDC006863]